MRVQATHVIILIPARAETPPGRSIVLAQAIIIIIIIQRSTAGSNLEISGLEIATRAHVVGEPLSGSVALRRNAAVECTQARAAKEVPSSLVQRLRFGLPSSLSQSSLHIARFSTLPRQLH